MGGGRGKGKEVAEQEVVEKKEGELILKIKHPEYSREKSENPPNPLER